MSNAVLSHPVYRQPHAAPGANGAIAAILAVWFSVVFVLGAEAAFVTPRSSIPVPIIIGSTTPLVVFYALLATSRRFREFLLSIDLRFMTAVQGWRFAGMGFLALYAHGILPGLFAWPAGLGDIAVGMAAPWMLAALLRQPDFAASRKFILWNALGILDLIVAVTMGTLSSGLVTRFAEDVTTAPMAQLPLVLIPAYFVPLFIMLHVAALLQARRMRRELSERR